MPTLPVGQTFKQFDFPMYDAGVLKYNAFAVEAKGITLNRIEATDLRIQVYENGAITTTITSPDADLYLNQQIDERKMRTKNTVEIDRSDMTATSQDCDFDLKNKKYLLRTNVKVVLKNFDLNLSAPGTPAAASSTSPAPTSAPKPAPAPSSPSPGSALAPALGPISPGQNDSSLLENPGSYANTNSAPLPPNPNPQ